MQTLLRTSPPWLPPLPCGGKTRDAEQQVVILHMSLGHTLHTPHVVFLCCTLYVHMGALSALLPCPGPARGRQGRGGFVAGWTTGQSWFGSGVWATAGWLSEGALDHGCAESDEMWGLQGRGVLRPPACRSASCLPSTTGVNKPEHGLAGCLQPEPRKENLIAGMYLSLGFHAGRRVPPG